MIKLIKFLIYYTIGLIFYLDKFSRASYKWIFSLFNLRYCLFDKFIDSL